MAAIPIAIFSTILLAIFAVDANVRFFELRPNRKKYLKKYGPTLEKGKTPILLYFLFGFFWAICLSSERNWRIHVWSMITIDVMAFLGISSYLIYRLVS